MRLRNLERLLINTPLKRLLQERVEYGSFREHLRKHSINLAGKVVLDAGCGAGFGTAVIRREFHPSRVVGVDMMPEQIRAAKTRNPDAEFVLGDVTAAGLRAGTFDAAFAVHMLHHVPQWQKAMQEMSRLLKPGGVFLVEEAGKGLTSLGSLFGCNPKETRFTWSEFEAALRAAGFDILEQKRVLAIFRSFLCRKVSG